jgi:proteasome beta subunit
VQADGSPWIHEIDHQCNITDYEERGFHAIGSGAPFAQLANALVAHFEVRQRPVEHGKLVAHRVMDIAISTSAYGIGAPIQMWQITGDQVSRMSDEELDAIRDSVGAWQEVEKAALDKHMSGSLEVIDLDAELPINGEPAGDGNTGVEPAPTTSD